MTVKLRLTRVGKTKQPQYRIVAADTRSPRDGRFLEILGEAARRVPDSIRGSHPSIPWRQIVGTRDRLIHGYDQVDLEVLWIIVQSQLPPLIAQLDAILGADDR